MKSEKKIVWIDCRDISKNKDKVALVNNLSFENILVSAKDLSKRSLPKKSNLIVEVFSQEDLDKVPNEAVVLSEDKGLLKNAATRGNKTAFATTIVDQKTMDEAWQEGLNYNYLVIELLAETNIPLELLIAKLQPTDTVLIKKVDKAIDAEIAYGVMESGSDGVLFSNNGFNELKALDKLLQKDDTYKMKLVKAKVTDVEHAGMGYRACIDTTNLFQKDEGMIIGSTSDGGLCVSSETHYLPYMDLRPFRVNAGAVHSYVWCPDDNTSYITELKGGAKVTCVDVKGNARDVTVGRVKTELRPLLKIEVEAEGKKINAFVQDDWHIRIFGGNGEPRNASTVAVGEELLAYVCEPGRHVGIKIDEHITEE
ncbi:MAG: 3-dehydroquinate synthase II [Cytophagales bacterium]|nr:3-dehydroquinate synthase II [Cytophagales bacterium]